MIAFDFLHDPRTLLLERLRAWKISRPLATAALALGTAVLVVGVGWSVERSRAVDARASVAALAAENDALHARLIGEKLEAAEVADLGALDGRLRQIAASGERFRARIAALAVELPRDAWLVSLSDDGRRLTLVGRTQRLSSVADAMSGLSGERFGAATLDRVARVERPGSALLEILVLGGRPMKISERTTAVVTWIAALVVLSVGYARIELHEARQIRTAEVEAATLRTRIERSKAILRDRIALRTARANIVSDIGAQASPGTGSDVATLLRSLERAARHAGIAIVSVDSAGSGSGGPANAWLRSRDVKLVLRGPFDRFLSFLPAFSKADPLVSVRDLAIVPAGGSGTRPSLVFTLGVAVYTVRAPMRKV